LSDRSIELSQMSEPVNPSTVTQYIQIA